MLPLVAVLVIIVAVLLGNRVHFEFSCHMLYYTLDEVIRQGERWVIGNNLRSVKVKVWYN